MTRQEIAALLACSLVAYVLLTAPALPVPVENPQYVHSYGNSVQKTLSRVIRVRHQRRTSKIEARTFIGYAHELSNKRGSVSIAGLPGPLVHAINQVQAACPGFRVISAFRPNARIAGTGRRSLHADNKAADIAGPNYPCAYRVLAGFPGGVSTDAYRMSHIHLSYDSGGREWGSRFAHGSGWKKKKWRRYTKR